MTNEPTVGQLVYLNSGSPPLTITEVYDDETVEVAWIDGQLAPQSTSFPTVCLTEVPTEPTA